MTDFDDPTIGELAADPTIDSERAESTFALFEGDEGGLDESERRTLVAVLKHRYVSARTHGDEWRTLLDSERRIRSRLNDLFLDLHIDRDREVAFKRQARSESTRRPFPTLLLDTPYTREETIILVYLRTRLRADTRPGLDQVVIDRQDIVAHVAGFRPASATDRTRDDARTTKALDRLVRARILLRTSDPERLRIASVVEVLLPLDRLVELDTWLRTATGQPTPPGDPTKESAATAQEDSDPDTTADTQEDDE